jgi:hypothetical protein
MYSTVPHPIPHQHGCVSAGPRTPVLYRYIVDWTIVDWTTGLDYWIGLLDWTVYNTALRLVQYYPVSPSRGNILPPPPGTPHSTRSFQPVQIFTSHSAEGRRPSLVRILYCTTPLPLALLIPPSPEVLYYTSYTSSRLSSSLSSSSSTYRRRRRSTVNCMYVSMDKSNQ